MKIAVVYYSQSGHTKEMADKVVKGIESVAGCEARAFPLDAIDKEYVKESCALIVGSPTYAGTACCAVQSWLESEAGGYDLAGKLGGAFATAAYVHGGGELGMLTILQHMLFLGMMVYSSGCAFGDPVIHLGPEAINADHDSFGGLFEIYGRRFAEQTMKTFGG
ncbi:MAG: flavodoxin domain-containing protein [Lachnospiraceae bacterium]|nr:flavodoxin domain-containing protein [Lachnospiraceae bacterium]